MVSVIIASLFAVTTVVVTRLFLAVASARRDVGRVLVLALDPGAVGDQAADRVAAEEGDRQAPRSGVEGLNRAGVLVAVDYAIVVAVVIARVVVGEELGAIAQLVMVLIPARLVDVSERWCRFSQRSGMRSWLPSLAAAIPGSASIASAAATSARPAGSFCLGANHRFLLGW